MGDGGGGHWLLGM